MREKRPVLVSYIVELNYLTIFVLTATLFPKILKRFGIITFDYTNVLMRIFVILLLIIISYGLLKLKQWGYWLMVAYNIFFLILSFTYLFNISEHPFYNPGYIAPILGLSLTFSAKRYFFKENKSV